MRLDPDLRLHVMETAGVMAARLSVAEPCVLMSTREVLEVPRRLTKGRRSTAYRYYGVAYTSSNMIFINVRKIPNKRALEETIAHEMVHIRFPYLSHGRRFYQLVQQVLQGRTFSPYRKRS